MRPPPLLLGVTLLFWGWQVNLLWVGVVLGLLIESAAVFKARWDFSNEDFERIWTLCSVLLLAMVLFAFTQNDGLSMFGSLLTDMNPSSQRGATVATARTASNIMRWMPMVFFPFLLAQTFSTRETIPLATISHILQRRWKLAQKAGANLPPGRGFNVGFPYFCMALLAASFHESDDYSFFLGFCVLLGWALWTLRSRRYSLVTWLSILIVAGVAGYFGQRSITYAQRYLVAFNAQWIARFMRRSDDPFQSRTQIGRLAGIKNSSSIAIRLTPYDPLDVPVYLREATYRRYERQTWFAGSSRDDFSTINEVPLSPTNQPHWQLIPNKTTRTAAQISCYLDGSENGLPSGLLPLPSGTARLEKLLAFSMKMNSAGAVVAQGPGLVVFDALYGPGETYDSPPGTNTRRNTRSDFNPEDNRPSRPADSESGRSDNRRRRFVADEDRDVPPQEIPAITAVLAELQLTTNTSYRVATAKLSAFFNEKFSYSTWEGLGRLAEEETPLGRFLLKTRSGHCEYFAPPTLLMLRRLGIPARYAVGYSVHETSGSDYVVRYSDAHAWTLAWDDTRKAWVDFDTTPATWVAAERKGLAFTRWLGDLWNGFKFELAKFRYGQSNVRKYLLWIVAPGLLLLIYQIVFRRGRQRHKSRKQDEAFLASWPGLDSDFYQLEKKLAARGITRSEAEPLGDWLHRVLESPGLTDLRAPFRSVLQLHYRHRFDPLGLSSSDRENLRRQTSRCLETLATRPATAGG